MHETGIARSLIREAERVARRTVNMPRTVGLSFPCVCAWVPSALSPKTICVSTLCRQP